jgi:hypothetical protein
MSSTGPQAKQNRQHFWTGVGVSVLALFVFYFSVNAPLRDFDYSNRIALMLLRGHVGLREQPPSWLNEMVPWQGEYYSVFPLGAVISVFPVAVLQRIRLVHGFPARTLSSLLAAACVYCFFHLSVLEGKSLSRRVLLAFFPIFATWTWCNVGFAGAWQIALGFALLGEVAALYFTLVRPNAFVAGTFFALAFGNRTELLLVAPTYLYYLTRASETNREASIVIAAKKWLRTQWPVVAQFLIVPAGLALATAAYNFARFGSIFDFGYAHIPKVLEEPWYRHGLFSLHALPWNMQKMLFEGFGDNPTFPYVRFYPFGCSIFLASPFLFLLFREGGQYKRAAWTAIALLTGALWCHGNPGGWQFSYRYAVILLPWMFLVIAGNGPPRLTVIEVSLFSVSLVINAIATYQFLWTNLIHP